jgi:hypothetical protein
LDGLLKDIYPKIITRALNNRVVALGLASRRKRTFEGRQAKFPAHVGRNPSVRYLTPGGTLATAQSQSVQQWTVPIRAQFPHIRITSDLMARTKTAAGAFARALAFETEGSLEDMRRQANRAAWGTGDGKLCEVFSLASAGTLHIKNIGTIDGSTGDGSGINGNAGARYLRVNDVIDIFGSSGTVKVQGAQVTSITFGSTYDTVTYTGGTVSAVPAITDGVYLNDPDLTNLYSTHLDPMGWGGIIDDGTFGSTTLFGITRTDYPLINAQVVNVGAALSTPGALTLEVLQRADDKIMNAGGTPQGYIIGHSSARLKYLDLCVVDRRYPDGNGYDPGIKENFSDKKPKSNLKFNDRDFIVDNDCPYRTIFMIPDEGPEFFEMIPPRPIDDGGGMLKLVPGTAGLFAVVYEWHYNLGVGEWGPNRYCVLRNIDVGTPDTVIPA